MKNSFPSAVALILLLSSACFAQDAAKQISAATVEIEKQLTTLKVSDDLKQQCTNDVADARANLKLGNLHLSLYTIRTCKLELSSIAYVDTKTNVQTKEAFDEEWRQFGSQLAETERTLSQPTPKPPPALVVALAQVSQVQVRRSYQSGQLSLNSNIAEGINQLGRASANLNFEMFLRSLRLTAPKDPMVVRSPKPELTKLETMALRSFKSADSNKQQAALNRLKSNLEAAEELNSASMFEGALLKYLESEFYFGSIVITAENEDLQHLEERTEEMGRLLTSGKTDHSIALLFWQMAQSALKSNSGAQPSQAEIKRVVVILNNVLPSYFDCLKVKK
jgi:ABC-type transporter Mla MlaB component